MAEAWDNRTGIYLGSAACAEFIADIFLCPLEACRIRSVSDPTFGSSLPSVAARLLREEGVVRGFYSGFGEPPPSVHVYKSTPLATRINMTHRCR